MPIVTAPVIDRGSGFDEVPGFAAPTPMASSRGATSWCAPPFDRGQGYYGLLFAALDTDDHPFALILTTVCFACR
ncbi:MAG: hypothetical protein WDN69_05900 [Aliidongia sp.]